MTSPSSSPIQNGYANQRDLMWSRSEKAIARKAFDAALERELHEVIQEAKQMANQIQQASDLWNLEQRTWAQSLISIPPLSKTLAAFRAQCKKPSRISLAARALSPFRLIRWRNNG